MTTDTDTRPGALLARKRWDRPELVAQRAERQAADVARRVDRIATDIAKLPTLTRAQRAQLVEAVKALPR